MRRAEDFSPTRRSQSRAAGHLTRSKSKEGAGGGGEGGGGGGARWGRGQAHVWRQHAGDDARLAKGLAEQGIAPPRCPLTRQPTPVVGLSREGTDVGQPAHCAGAGDGGGR